MNLSRLDPGRFGFVVLVLVALINGAAIYFAEQSFVQLRLDADRALRTQAVLVKLNSALAAIFNAESLQRDYLITGNVAYRTAYVEGVANAKRQIEELGQLVRDNPVQIAQMDTVRSMAQSRIQLLEGGIAQFGREGGADVEEQMRSGRGKFAMDALLLSLAGMEAEERAQSEKRNSLLEFRRLQIRRGAIVSAGLNLVLVTLGAIFLLRDQRRRANEHAKASRHAMELEQTVAERTAELSELSQFLQRFQEEERARIARDIHDELGGTLAAAKIDLQLLSDKLGAGHAQAPRIAQVVSAIDDAVQVKRRIIEDLRPTLLDNLGIAAALRWQCDQFSKRSGQRCQVEIDEAELTLRPDHSIAFYRIVQEALTNASKYAKSRNVIVSLRRDADHWLLQVGDDGAGFDHARPRNRTAHGLLSMRERARALGGDLVIESAPGRGTVLRVRVPIDTLAQAGDNAPVGGA